MQRNWSKLVAHFINFEVDIQINLSWMKQDNKHAWKSTWQLRDALRFFAPCLSSTHANKYWRLHADKFNSDLHVAWPCWDTMEHTLSKICLKTEYVSDTVIHCQDNQIQQKNTKCEKYFLIQLMIAMPIVSIPVMVAFPAALGVYWVSIIHWASWFHNFL